MGHAGTGRRGSIRQSANGSWFFVVDVTQPGGERQQTRRRGFTTRRDAQKELTRVLTSVDDRAYIKLKRQTVATFLTETWLPAVQHTIKPATFESYQRNVRLHVRSAHRSPTPPAARGGRPERPLRLAPRRRRRAPAPVPALGCLRGDDSSPCAAGCGPVERHRPQPSRCGRPTATVEQAGDANLDGTGALEIPRRCSRRPARRCVVAAGHDRHAPR